MDGDALWDAIMANPDDVGARLVYGDWLQQRGDPRGELITIHCQLETTFDRALRDRANALIAQCNDRWCDELGIERTYTEKGIPYSIHASLRANLLDVLERAPYRDIRFNIDSQRDADPVAAARAIAADPRLERIREINTLTTPFGEAGLRALLGSPYLTNLHTLAIGDHDCHGYAIDAIAKANLPSLRTLCLFSNDRGSLDDDDYAVLAETPKLAQLHTLKLHRPRGSVETARAFAASKTLNLRTFVWAYGGYGLRSEGLELLATSPAFANLEHLDLQDADLGRYLDALASPQAFPALRTLDLSRNNLSNIDALATGGIANLERLDLSGNPIGLALRPLANAPRFAKMAKLGLRGTLADTAAVVAASPYATGIRELDVSDCKFRDEGAIALGASTSLDAIEVLNVCGNRIGSKGMKALRKFGDRVVADRKTNR